MDKTNLRFDWIGETEIVKHWDDLTKDEILQYVYWLEEKVVKSCSIPNVVGRSELLNAFLDYSDKIYWGENEVTDRRQVIEQFLKSIQ